MPSIPLHFALLRQDLSLNVRHLPIWLNRLANNLSGYVSSHALSNAGVTGTCSCAHPAFDMSAEHPNSGLWAFMSCTLIH